MTSQVLTLPSSARSIGITKAKLSVALISATMLVGLMVGTASAQSQTPANAPVAPAAKVPTPAPKPLAAAKPKTPTPSTAAVSPSKPDWKELTPAQQGSLQPLQSGWDSFSEGHKRKWIAIAQNYATLPSAEQNKLHSRMREWASLSAREREQARLNFAETSRLTPAEKAANWQAYQALSPEEKQKLAAKAAAKPVGAAAAVKPVAPQKLAAVPLTRHISAPAKGGASMAASGHLTGQIEPHLQGQSTLAPVTDQKN